MIGATTENPSFEINSALLSRCKVFVLKALDETDLTELLTHALTSPKGFGMAEIAIEETHFRAIARFANGDARTKCLPESLAEKWYYLPTEEGNEKAVKERLEEILAWRNS